jgi:hypothetical protein
VPLPFVGAREPFVAREPPFVDLWLVSIGICGHPAFT